MNREEQRATIESRIEAMLINADRAEYLLAHWCIVMMRAKTRDLSNEFGREMFDSEMQHANWLLERYQNVKATTTTL